MSHELEQHGDQVAYVDNQSLNGQVSPWHRLNQLPKELIGQLLTAEQVLKEAHFADWDVQKVPAYAEVNGVLVPNQGQFAVTRTNPFTGERELFQGSSVGSSWQPFQNEQLVNFLDALVSESGAHGFETAGSLRGGREVFASMEIPESMTVGGTDKLKLYLAGLNAHDGKKAFRPIITPVRIVCANTQRWGESSAVAKTSIRHTTNMDKTVARVQQYLGLAYKQIESLQTEFEQMINTTMTDAEFLDKVGILWPKDEHSGPRFQAREDAVLKLFLDAETQANIRGTNYAGLQAVGEYLDHFQPVQGKDKDEKRAERTLIGTDAIRGKAFKLFQVGTPA